MTPRPAQEGTNLVHPDLAVAILALQHNDPARAEALLRACLASRPDDVEALRLLAGIAASTGFSAVAEQLLRKAITLAPAFVAAHVDLSSLLCRLERAGEAIALLDLAMARQPGAVWPLSLKAAVLDAERRTEEALALHQELVARAPHAAIPWLNYGHALRAVGRVEEAIAAYRTSLEIDPGNGFAWRALTDLRTVRLGPVDIEVMDRALPQARDGLQGVQLHFALGRARGDNGDFALSWRHYEKANQLRQRLAPYDPGATSDLVRQVESRFSTEFFVERAGDGCDASDPIFIIGMPRSGSTLVEQILASHPMIEGCGELFELQNLAAGLGGGGAPESPWPEVIARMGADELQALGQRYLASVRRHRRTDRPFFTDKMPSNWRYVGLIHLILPRAKIIDVRRHPLACCFSAFTTYFNRETSFPTSLEDLGRYHADYVHMVAHLEAVLPERIHKVEYERLVNDFVQEVHRLLDDLGLPFDPACLRFHDNPRAVHTPSAQQVRRPVSAERFEFWRNYESWLAPLKGALESVPTVYPRSPAQAHGAK
jgi:tetratricopeptide (TPR) repeat protein